LFAAAEAILVESFDHVRHMMFGIGLFGIFERRRGHRGLAAAAARESELDMNRQRHCRSTTAAQNGSSAGVGWRLPAGKLSIAHRFETDPLAVLQFRHGVGDVDDRNHARRRSSARETRNNTPRRANRCRRAPPDLYASSLRMPAPEAGADVAGKQHFGVDTVLVLFEQSAAQAKPVPGEFS